MGRLPATTALAAPISRRGFLRGSAHLGGALSLSLFGQAFAVPAAAAASGADAFGPLQAPDANGLRLPAGFSSRVVAVTGEPVASVGYVWHERPDGGATFATGDGGWIYVSNSEAPSGGASALRFAADGSVVDAYSILDGTSMNCAGGPTPWGTWLSCEEIDGGRVWECSPAGAGSPGVVLPALGVFRHEAAAVDPIHGRVYLTEDKNDGLLYRFTPSSYPDLSSGILEAAEILDPGGAGPIAPGELRGLAWHPVPDASPANGGVQSASHLPLQERATRYQVADATPFDRGEGCWYADGHVYFSTTTQSRVWRIDTATDEIGILFDPVASPGAPLADADNLFALPGGDVYVAEDADDLQIVALTATGAVKPFMQLTGTSGTEITGPAITPDGQRMYFSSQRNPGVTYEVSGPFAPGPLELPSLARPGTALLAGALAAVAAWRLRHGLPKDDATAG
jgi:secreted PhoX family phosphatase